MKAVSANWQNAIYAQTRETKAVIEFPFIDPQAKSSAELNSLPAESVISQSLQIIDDGSDGVGKVAEFEPGYWKLDGSFILPVKGSPNQYGFRGYALSDENGEFTTDNVLRFHFTEPITVPGYTLYFDEKANEYLTDFDIIAYDESLSVIRKVEVRNNNTPKCTIDYGSENIKYLDLVFRKTNHPQRSVRLIEIDFGILLKFEGENLYTVQLTSESDYLAETVPYNELVFTAHNQGEYDYTNPESYSKYLQERQSVRYTHKTKLDDGTYESINMGEYLLHKWKVSDRKVEFNARADMYALDDTIYSRNSLSEGISAGLFMERIFADCGITKYIIPDFMYDSPDITPYVGEDCTNKEAMRQVASLCGCAVYRTPDGVTVIHKVEFKDAPVDAIDYANEFSAPSSTSTQYYNAIQLNVYTVNGDSFSSTVETYTAPWYQSGEAIYPYKMDLKMCINDSRWQALKPWVLEQKFRVLGYRLHAELEWRQNPAQDVGDYVQVQLDKSGRTAELFMQKQVLSYRGGVLKGNSVGIGRGKGLGE